MFSQLTIVGYLGDNPTMRFMPNGDPVTTFPVATSSKYKDKETTTWFRVSVFGAQAEACNTYLSKGRPVLVVGTLKPDAETGGPRVWSGEDGKPHANFEVTAQTVRFLPSGKGEAAPSGQSEDDGIPF